MSEFDNYLTDFIQKKFMQFDEDALDAREQQGIAQKGLGTRPMSDRPGMTKEVVDVKEDRAVSNVTRVLTDMFDYYEPDEFPTQDVRIDSAPKFGSLNRSTVLDILSANRDGLEKQGIIKMPMGMFRKADPTLDIDGLQSRILDKLDYKTPEGSPQDIQYGAELGKLGEVEGVGDESIDVDSSRINIDEVRLDPIPEGGLGSPRTAIKTGTTVKEAQQTLTDLGYKPQGVDGILGKGSARAIRKLQKAADLPITGELTTEVIALLKSGDAPAYFDPPKPDAKVESIPESIFNIFREAIAQKESSDRYNIRGGANKHYDGRYQMGEGAKLDAARMLGITLKHDAKSRRAFRKDKDLQDRAFKAYTTANHIALTKNSQEYRDMSMKEKLGVLGYAHNQGAVAAEEWLYTGVSGADSFGTKGDEYTSLVRDSFSEESPSDTPN